MPAINWGNALADAAVKVAYSSMMLDETREAEGTVAEFLLPGDHFIDISWFRDSGYNVRLYQGFFENVVGDEYICSSAKIAIDIARELAISAGMRPKIEHKPGTAYINFDPVTRRDSIRAMASALIKDAGVFAKISSPPIRKGRHPSAPAVKKKSRRQNGNARYSTVISREGQFV